MEALSLQEQRPNALCARQPALANWHNAVAAVVSNNQPIPLHKIHQIHNLCLYQAFDLRHVVEQVGTFRTALLRLQAIRYLETICHGSIINNNTTEQAIMVIIDQMETYMLVYKDDETILKAILNALKIVTLQARLDTNRASICLRWLAIIMDILRRPEWQELRPACCSILYHINIYHQQDFIHRLSVQQVDILVPSSLSSWNSKHVDCMLKLLKHASRQYRQPLGHDHWVLRRIRRLEERQLGLRLAQTTYGER